MSTNSSLSRPELDDRIAIARDNIRQLIEQAAAASGAEDEARNAERLAQQNDELQRLIAQRDALPQAGTATGKAKPRTKAKTKPKTKAKTKAKVKKKKAAKKKAKPAAKKKKKR